MNTLVEITELAGIDLEGAPPCELTWYNVDTHDEFRCGKPSVIRLYIQCGNCGNQGARFYCGECWKHIKQGITTCYHCGTPVTSVREM